MAEAPNTPPSRKQIWRMFDRIAARYDLLNRLLSMGRDVAWRKTLCRSLPHRSGMRVVDVATGTADVLLAVERARGIQKGVGVDMSFGMLRHGAEKVRKRQFEEELLLVRGDGLRLPLRDSSFDVATIAFGIRNVADTARGIRELQRVLEPGGSVYILEFSLPGNPIFRMLYLFYFRHILPLIGGLISGDFQAYRYLNQTVESFPYGRAFCQLMEANGFSGVKAKPLTFGIATLYVGQKES